MADLQERINRLARAMDLEFRSNDGYYLSKGFDRWFICGDLLGDFCLIGTRADMEEAEALAVAEKRFGIEQ